MGDGGHESLLLRFLQIIYVFFANHLSPITFFEEKLYKLLVDKEIVCVTDA